MQRLADDPRLNADVRETVSNLRATSESVANLAARFEGIHLPGEKRAAPTPERDPVNFGNARPAALLFDHVAAGAGIGIRLVV